MDENDIKDEDERILESQMPRMIIEQEEAHISKGMRQVLMALQQQIIMAHNRAAQSDDDHYRDLIADLIRDLSDYYLTLLHL